MSYIFAKPECMPMKHVKCVEKLETRVFMQSKNMSTVLQTIIDTAAD